MSQPTTSSVEEVLEALQKAFRPNVMAQSEGRPDVAQHQDSESLQANCPHCGKPLLVSIGRDGPAYYHCPIHGRWWFDAGGVLQEERRSPTP
jgi:hypothetical protein